MEISSNNPRVELPWEGAVFLLWVCSFTFHSLEFPLITGNMRSCSAERVFKMTPQRLKPSSFSLLNELKLKTSISNSTMSGIMKVFLLLGVMICLSRAQSHQSGSQCLCSSVGDLRGMRSKVQSIQIYPKTVFCLKEEYVVTLKDGYRFCLNPNSVKKYLENILKPKVTTDKPNMISSTPESSSTARL